MPDTPPRFFRRGDGRLHPAGWLLLALGAVIVAGLAILTASPMSPAASM